VNALVGEGLEGRTRRGLRRVGVLEKEAGGLKIPRDGEFEFLSAQSVQREVGMQTKARIHLE
jgi:hypothetical protein